MKKLLASVLALVLLIPTLTVSALAESEKPTWDESLSHISVTTSAEEELGGAECYVDSYSYRLGDWYYEGEGQIPEECDFGDGVYDFQDVTGYNALRPDSTLTVTNTATDTNCSISLYLDVYTHEIYGAPEDTVSSGGGVNAGVGTNGPKVSLPEGIYVYLVDQSNFLAKSGRWEGLGAVYSEDDMGTEVELFPGESFTFDFSDIEVTDIMKEGLGQPDDDNIYALQASIHYPDLNFVRYFTYYFRVDEAFIDSMKTVEQNAPSSWAEDDVMAAGQAGLIPTLTGSPKYQDAITREQFAELVVQTVTAVCGAPTAAPADVFTDTTNPAVFQAYGAGIVSGMGDKVFAPTTATNREQIGKMIANAVSYIEQQTGRELTPNAADLSRFTDKDQVSSWAVDGMGVLAANNIMGGTSDTTLAPKSPCTVEQSILLLYRVYERFQAA